MYKDARVSDSKKWELCAHLEQQFDGERVLLWVDRHKGVRFHGRFKKGDSLLENNINDLVRYSTAAKANLRPQRLSVCGRTTFDFEQLVANVLFEYVSTRVDPSECVGGKRPPNSIFDKVERYWYRVEAIGAWCFDRFYFGAPHRPGLRDLYGDLNTTRFGEYNLHEPHAPWTHGCELTVPLAAHSFLGHLSTDSLYVSDAMKTRLESLYYVIGDQRVRSYQQFYGSTAEEIQQWPRTWDLYDDLGLKPTATAGEIKKAYFRLSMKAHPDKGGSNAAFQRINRAYRVLAKHRVDYDRQGDEEGQSWINMALVQNPFILVV